jgi:hypothetical protein
MSRLDLVSLSTILAVAAACGPDVIPGPPVGFAHAAATPACGPTDGPAIWIYLAPSPVDSVNPPAPYVRIAVGQPLDRVAGRSWPVAAGDGSAAAWFFSGGNDFRIATGGRVTINVVDTTSTIRGSADLMFPTIGRIWGGFRATWISGAPLCG